MPQAAVQGTESSVVHTAKSDKSDERVAPNNRLAVLVGDKWAGYLFDDSGGTCGRGSKEIVLFDVEEAEGGGLKVTRSGACDSKSKKLLGKQIHHEKVIRFFDARTDAGDRCQLFTL